MLHFLIAIWDNKNIISLRSTEANKHMKKNNSLNVKIKHKQKHTKYVCIHLKTHGIALTYVYTLIVVFI